MKVHHSLATYLGGAADMNKRCAMWLPTFLQRGIHFFGERTEVLAFNNFVLFDRVHLPMIGKRAAAVEEDYVATTELHGSNGLRAIGVSGFTRPKSPLMNTVRFILPSEPSTIVQKIVMCTCITDFAIIPAINPTTMYQIK